MLYILDTETHNLADPRPTQIAYVACEFVCGVLTQVQPLYCELFNPQAPISLGAMAITHITDELVKDKPSYTKFKMPSDCSILACHNVGFDEKVLLNTGVNLDNVAMLCTLGLMRHFYSELETHTLTASCYHLCKDYAIKHAKHAHNAGADVLMTYQVLKAICIEQGICSMDELKTLTKTSTTPTTFTFGKYKGESLAKIAKFDPSYIKWVFNNTDDVYLKSALQAFL